MTTRHYTQVDPNPVAAQGPMAFHSVGSADLFNGAYTQIISIPLPPARNNFAPSVSLVYNSDVEAGLLGPGWNLPVPYIARDLSFGMPLYRETKGSELGPLVYQIGSSAGRLRYVSSPNADMHLFRPEREHGDFLRFFLHWEERYWEVFDTNGNRWVLGASPNSRDSDDIHVFAWYVETIQDRHENQIAYSYLKHDGVLYPHCIEYDQGALQPAYPKVEFTWKHVEGLKVCPGSVDVCVDDHRVSYRKGFRADYNWKLGKVTVTGYDENGQAESRSYDIAYEASKSYGRGKKLSGKMTVDPTGKFMVGTDESYMGGHSLSAIRPQESTSGHPSPATFFQYFDVQEDFPKRQEFSWQHDGAAWKQSIHSTRTNVYYNKTDFDNTEETSYAYHRIESMLVDMDGDGKLDLLFADAPEGHANLSKWRFYRNKGGFEFEHAPVTINGVDGLPWLESTWSVSHTKLKISGAPPNEKLTGYLNTIREDHTEQMVLDINGDGRTEIVSRDNKGHIFVRLGEPDGEGWRFGEKQDWGAPGSKHSISVLEPFKEYTKELRTYGLKSTTTVFDRLGGGDDGVIRQWVDVDLVDMNGDGLPDYVEATPQGLEVYLNEGTHFSSTPYLVTLPKDAYIHAGEPCVSESIGEFNDAFVDVNGNYREMRVKMCRTMALIDLNGDKIPDLVLNQPWEAGLSFGIPKDEKAFRYAPGTLGGFDTAHNTTIDFSDVPVMVTFPTGEWTDKNGEEGLFIDMNGDGLKDYVMLGRQDPDKVILYVRYNTGHGFLPGYGWEVKSPAGDWANFPEKEWLTNADDTFDKSGNGISYLRRALVDINGDGAMELINIAADVNGKDYWRIYSRSDPATPLGFMSASHSETGMDLGLTYRSISDNGESSLPFPKWYLKALQRRDTVTNVSLTQEYSPSGAYYDAEKREFSGFAHVTVTDPIKRFEYSFWNSKDAADACKRGQLRTVGVYTTDALSRLLVENELEHTRITFPGEEREWARLEKVTNRITDVDPPITSKTVYEYEAGALAINFGLLKQAIYNPGTPDERRDVYKYCTLDPGTSPGRALVRIHMIVRKDRDGLNELAKEKYLYDLKDSLDGCTGITKGDLSAFGAWRNGYWAMSGLEYDAIGRLNKTVSPDNVIYSYEYYGNTPFLMKHSNAGKSDLSIYYSGYHALSGKPTKICGPAYRAGQDPKDDSCTEYTFDKYGRVLSVGGTMSEVIAAASGQLAQGSWQKGVVQQNEYYDLSLGASPWFIEGRADPTLGGAIAVRNSGRGRSRHMRRWKEYYDSLGSLVMLEERAGQNEFVKLYIDYTPFGQVQKTWARITSNTEGYARYTNDASELQKSYSYEYDPLGRVSKITNPDGTSSGIEFKGNVVTYEDELKHHFEAEMNKYGEVVAKRSWTAGGMIRDPLTGLDLPLPMGDLLQSQYEYDAAGQLKKAVDPEGGIYVYEYDLDGSLKRVKSPVSNWIFDYTSSGKLRKINKSSGASVEVEYDDRGRISILKEHPGNGCGAANYREHRYFYDASPDPALGSDEEYAGRLAEVNGEGYRVTFGYNGQGVVDRVALRTPATSTQPTMWVERLYLATGEVAQALFSNKQLVSYKYDDLGRLIGLKAADLLSHYPKYLTARVQYNQGGQLEQVEGTLDYQPQRLFRFRRTHNYGSNGFVSSIDTQILGKKTWLLQQWYELNGQISRIRDDGLRDVDHTYYYDGSNRLIRADGYDNLPDGMKNLSGQIVFQYHKNSALASAAVPQQFVENYYYDSLKQRLDSRTAPAGSSNYAYDGDGRRCLEKRPDGEIASKWTGGGNLARVTNQINGETLQFEYSAVIGRWLADRSGRKTYYFDMLEFSEADNIHSLHVPLPGGIMCTLRTGGAPDICTFSDEHGTGAVFTEAGELIENTEYLPYGEKHIMSGGAGSGFGFAGQRAEEATGLSYFGARYYDTRARQWISADPSLTGALPGSTIFGLDVLQPFVYASADPVSKFDVGGFESNYLTYVEGGLTLFGGLPVCQWAAKTGAKIGAKSANNPAGDLIVAGLSAYSAVHTGEIAAGKATARGLGGLLLKISPRLLGLVRFAAGASTVLNVLQGAYYGGRPVVRPVVRGVVGLARVGRRVLNSMRPTATAEEFQAGRFSQAYEGGLRTAEGYDLKETYGNLPGWKATPLGFWYDELAAMDIESEIEKGFCLSNRGNIDRLYSPNPVNLVPVSEEAKAFEQYAIQWQRRREEAFGGRASSPVGGGAPAFSSDPSSNPEYGRGGGSSGGSDSH